MSLPHHLPCHHISFPLDTFPPSPHHPSLVTTPQFPCHYTTLLFSSHHPSLATTLCSSKSLPHHLPCHHISFPFDTCPPSLPSHSVPVPNRPTRLCGRKATLNQTCPPSRYYSVTPLSPYHLSPLSSPYCHHIALTIMTIPPFLMSPPSCHHTALTLMITPPFLKLPLLSSHCPHPYDHTTLPFNDLPFRLVTTPPSHL